MAKTLFKIELLSNQLIIVSSYIYLGMTVFVTPHAHTLKWPKDSISYQ